MSTVENVFLQTDLAGQQVLDDWLVPLFGLESVPGEPSEGGEYYARGPAIGVDGWLGFVVRPNSFQGVDPEPDDVQAFDAYPPETAIRYGTRVEGVQEQQARLIFEKLVETRPDVPMLLAHDLDLLVGAHLPGGGTQYWPDPPTVDAPDQDDWRPWVTETRGR
ncbi:hypothetical protein [Streptomyces sp. SID13031]|uniref:hypothetical protein n=1 Tax=Streptomyces sp. SID13031 TaxID=2706046 RepID=UPI0013C67811|nr:hypothetical protein [Streptomyces sp. SID13031]NEA30157.1 hypothetical protein [Streptomyces sp. SID13031]